MRSATTTIAVIKNDELYERWRDKERERARELHISRVIFVACIGIHQLSTQWIRKTCAKTASTSNNNKNATIINLESMTAIYRNWFGRKYLVMPGKKHAVKPSRARIALMISVYRKKSPTREKNMNPQNMFRTMVEKKAANGSMQNQWKSHKST